MGETLAPPPSGPFELSGGTLCLDFVNTWGDRNRPATDQLGGYVQLLHFGRQAGLLSESEGARLATLAAAQPNAAAAALGEAREVREALYRIFSARARGVAAAADDLARLNAALGKALARPELAASGEGFAWLWRAAGDDLAAPLWPIVRSAGDLLTGAELSRVRECDGAQCTWLFLDRSRGGSRRWCSMQSCGNRAKARRHYQRQRAE